MKKTALLLTAIMLFCVFATACGDIDKAPTEYPNSEWVCTSAEGFIKVYENGEHDAELTNDNGESVKVRYQFNDAEKSFSITSEDGESVYIKGTYTFKEKSVFLYVSDTYGSDFCNLASILTLIFEKQ